MARTKHVFDETGPLFSEDVPLVGEFVGCHLGPRTKYEYPYSYDPILQFTSGKKATGSVYTDHFTRWYGFEQVRLLQEKHLGKRTDYYSSFTPTQIQNFLRELMDKPTLEIVRIEEHCNQSTGYPCWYIAFCE